MPTDFVDRVEYMDAFRDLLADLSDHRGRALVVEGSTGMGRTALLAELARRINEVPANAGAFRVVEARCHPGTGPGDPYAVVADLVAQLEGRAEQGRWRLLRTAGRAAARSAPEVLASFVPGLNALWAVGREIAEAALGSGSTPLDSVLPTQFGAVAQIADALQQNARSGKPVVLLVDDVQYIDPSSLMVLNRLVERRDEAPLALVVSYGPDADGDRKVGELLDRWAGMAWADRHVLGGLPPEAVEELVRIRKPAAPDGLAAQLVELTRGHSVFVSLCLDAWQAEQGTELVVPRSLDRLLEQRMARLSGADRQLLEIAAVQGPQFFSRVLAEAAGEPHENVLQRLVRIARDTRLIEERPLPPWARYEESDCYVFEHGALWQLIYHPQSTELKRSRHAAVARALSADPARDDQLEWRLEIARHLEHGGVRCLDDSARAHYELARGAALDGLSFLEAEQHCNVAIRATRMLPDTVPDRNRRLVAAIELQLSLTEVRWRGLHESGGGPAIDALAVEAEAAATACGDPVLIARTTLLRGKTLLVTQGLEPSLAKLEEAVRRAEQADEPVAVFVAKVEYGRQVSKRRLSEGLTQLAEAERMYAENPALGATDDPVLHHSRNLGEMQLAINLFDLGRLGEALTRLERCVHRLRADQFNSELPMALNYLAQVHSATGSWTEAEQVLREALRFQEIQSGESGWHAYNLALLAGLVARDRARRQEALDLMTAAWEETERTWLANLVPIVRNLYAGLLLELSDQDPLLRGFAAHKAEETYRETEHTGMVRSRIAALVLRSRAELADGHREAALALADEALTILDEVGAMPALRTEEVLFHAARAFAAAGRRERAAELSGRAADEVERKSASIEDPALRERFLTEVPLNQEIRAAAPGVGRG
ncbi:AAA family ATPase [Kitasatospora sp. YST-16]|uniref:AAA family ATPase n=1 Tax=Kitasatospora sp. YST-16 TaxID=2998080 RepID=UPI002283F242|nr:AAA family ATPase [Kitasatospora sp. YST-16]WAL72865.1 AAA family ATPase [Kitasatospora sp. YST-16]WNW38915.1 AAA family ATPase [Streptomyces sp. Li-HN-5-13]